jgi:hypothetical protein
VDDPRTRHVACASIRRADSVALHDTTRLQSGLAQRKHANGVLFTMGASGGIGGTPIAV